MITFSSNPLFFSALIICTMVFGGSILWAIYDLEKDSKPNKKSKAKKV